MKISKFVRTVKRCGKCVLYHGPGGEIWLSNNEAVYRAEEMPDMTVGQLRAVLDVPEKAWTKIVKIERRVESLRNMEGLNLEQDGDELEVVQMPARVVPGALACYKAEKTGELFFVDDGLLCPIEDRIEESGYSKFAMRKTERGAPYLVVYDGFDLIGAIMSVRVLNEKFLGELSDFLTLCTEQYARDVARQPEGGEGFGQMAFGEGETE